jgi:hypothetical protein
MAVRTRASEGAVTTSREGRLTAPRVVPTLRPEPEAQWRPTRSRQVEPPAGTASGVGVTDVTGPGPVAVESKRSGSPADRAVNTLHARPCDAICCEGAVMDPGTGVLCYATPEQGASWDADLLENTEGSVCATCASQPRSWAEAPPSGACWTALLDGAGAGSGFDEDGRRRPYGAAGSRRGTRG